MTKTALRLGGGNIWKCLPMKVKIKRNRKEKREKKN